MKRTGSVKRVARKIGGGGGGGEDEGHAADAPGSVVKRPSLPTKAKKSSKLRMSFGPGSGTADNDDDDSQGSGIITPRKPLRRQAIERAADTNEERPSYSKDALSELKQSTPSTPKDVSSQVASEDEGGAAKSLDLATKFGATSLTRTASAAAHIPSATEIAEKKERRARLAKEKEFISLNPDDSDEERQELLLRPKEKYAETKLVRDDEDVLEGFEQYVDDTKLALGRKAEREQKRKKRQEMQELIASAEGVNSDGEGGVEEDDSEAERNEAYEAAQTRAGTYSTHHHHHHTSKQDQDQPRTPPRITPVPDLTSVLTRMRTNLQEMRDAKAAKEMRLEELKQEKMEMKQREAWIQSQLKEVGQRYEKLRQEAGMVGGEAAGDSDVVRNGHGQGLLMERGLESFGNTPLPGSPVVGSDDG